MEPGAGRGLGSRAEILIRCPWWVAERLTGYMELKVCVPSLPQTRQRALSRLGAAGNQCGCSPEAEAVCLLQTGPAHVEVHSRLWDTLMVVMDKVELLGSAD